VLEGLETEAREERNGLWADQCPKQKSMSIEEATYDKIKDQIVARQK
jgi:hypothetical protein